MTTEKAIPAGARRAESSITIELTLISPFIMNGKSTSPAKLPVGLHWIVGTLHIMWCQQVGTQSSEAMGLLVQSILGHSKSR